MSDIPDWLIFLILVVIILSGCTFTLFSKWIVGKLGLRTKKDYELLHFQFQQACQIADEFKRRYKIAEAKLLEFEKGEPEK